MIDQTERERLGAEITARNERVLTILAGLVDLARDPARPAGAIISARLQLGSAIRLRRSLIEEALRLGPASGGDGALAVARDAKRRVHDLALVRLGLWPAARMEAEPDALMADVAPIIAPLIAAIEDETRAVLVHLSGA